MEQRVRQSVACWSGRTGRQRSPRYFHKNHTAGSEAITQLTAYASVAAEVPSFQTNNIPQPTLQKTGQGGIA